MEAIHDALDKLDTVPYFEMSSATPIDPFELRDVVGNRAAVLYTVRHTIINGHIESRHDVQLSAPQVLVMGMEEMVRIKGDGFDSDGLD